MNRETRDTLWHAIVGLTDLLVHQRVEHAQYRQLVEGLEVEVRASQPAGLEPQGFAAEDGTLVPACEAGRIAVDFEYQFMLYRHWSLYEAMLHSPYVASKLLLWWAHGRQRLDELLAKMGFSLSQCKCVAWRGRQRRDGAGWDVDAACMAGLDEPNLTHTHNPPPPHQPTQPQQGGLQVHGRGPQGAPP